MGTEAVGPTPEQKVQWEEEGYIVLEDALHGAQLQRLQAAFDKATVECKEDRLQRVARGEAQPTFFDIPDRCRARRDLCGHCRPSVLVWLAARLYRG